MLVLIIAIVIAILVAMILFSLFRSIAKNIPCTIFMLAVSVATIILNVNYKYFDPESLSQFMAVGVFLGFGVDVCTWIADIWERFQNARKGHK